jgi:hypothetical protein
MLRNTSHFDALLLQPTLYQTLELLALLSRQAKKMKSDTIQKRTHRIWDYLDWFLILSSGIPLRLQYGTECFASTDTRFTFHNLYRISGNLEPNTYFLVSLMVWLNHLVRNKRIYWDYFWGLMVGPTHNWKRLGIWDVLILLWQRRQKIPPKHWYYLPTHFMPSHPTIRNPNIHSHKSFKFEVAAESNDNHSDRNPAISRAWKTIEEV